MLFDSSSPSIKLVKPRENFFAYNFLVAEAYIFVYTSFFFRFFWVFSFLFSHSFLLINSYNLLPRVLLCNDISGKEKERNRNKKMSLMIISLNVQSNHHGYLHTVASFRSISQRSFCTRLGSRSS